MKTKSIIPVIFLLALALVLSSISWLPGHAAPAQERSASSHFKARLVGTDLIIDGDNFRDQHAFFVKARRQIGYRWARLGAVTTGNDDRLHGRYPLTKELRKAQSVRVCLKDIYTDEVFCTYAFR
jgi:hypothetical protein